MGSGDAGALGDFARALLEVWDSYDPICVPEFRRYKGGGDVHKPGDPDYVKHVPKCKQGQANAMNVNPSCMGKGLLSQPGLRKVFARLR